VVGLDVVLQTHHDNQGLVHRFWCLARFQPPGVKHGTSHCYCQSGEHLHLVRKDQSPVQYILGSDGLSFLRALIFVENDVQRLVGMHSHLMTKGCGRC